MKNINKFTLVALSFIMNNAYSQTCRTESEIPSSTPDSRFTNNQDGTITDKGTGLMWQRCQLGRLGVNCELGNQNRYDWQEAFAEAQSSSVANYTDWRLPNHPELNSIIEQRCFDPSINTTFFPNTTNSIFWTSSLRASNSDFSWYVGFSQGSANLRDRGENDYVRLVREIQ